MSSTINVVTWTELAPLVARDKRFAAGAPATLPDRAFFEALVYLADIGFKWRQLPEHFGAWDAVYNRYRRWLTAGVFERLFADLPAASAGLDDVRRVFVDSTVILAHPHAGALAQGGGLTRRSAAVAAGSRRRSTSPAPTRRRPSRSS